MKSSQDPLAKVIKNFAHFVRKDHSEEGQILWFIVVASLLIAVIVEAEIYNYLFEKKFSTFFRSWIFTTLSHLNYK